MKLIFTAVLFSFFSTVAYTGHPDKDPVVKYLRSQFEEARVPSEDDLRLGEDIFCIEYAAMPSNYQVSQAKITYKLRKIGGILFHNDRMSRVKSFLITEHGLIGTTVGGGVPYMNTIRVTTNGDLIAEWAVSNEHPEASSDWTKSSVHSDYLVVNYTLCPLEYKNKEEEGEEKEPRKT